MPQEIVPSLCVVPIVGLNDDGGCGPFLGTGFFAGERKRLVTCDHVLAKWDGAYGISAHEDAPRLYPSSPILRKSGVDLACLEVEEYAPEYAFPLEVDAAIILNQLVCCFEYGTTDVAGRRINFSPANRLGNVTRVLDLTERFGRAGSHMLEMSFPALGGASGAPVILSHPPFRLWGVVTANVARELLPAQIERIYDEGGRVEEETRFLLPQALAIHVMHVRALLHEVDED
jgi:hypothetical protein